MIKILIKKRFEKTTGFCDIIDTTPELRSELQSEKITCGQVTLFVSGSTAALRTIEYARGLVQDVKEFVERLIPSDRRYCHDARPHHFLAHRWSFRLRIAQAARSLAADRSAGFDN
ncbi:MAG TPA: YjbQ family protein, partial [Candidatus Binatia bacterium]|nr:YjbQ family protein [Candidatus Binatia bacterium]